MAELVYFCSTVVSVVCALVLARSYWENKTRLLMWVAVSFAFLALTNIFAVVDLIVLPEVDMWGAIVRNGLFAVAGSVLAIGLVWELS